MVASNPNHPCPPRPGRAQAASLVESDHRLAAVEKVLRAIRDGVEISAKALDIAEAVHDARLIDPPGATHRLAAALHWCIATLNGETDVPPPVDFRDDPQSALSRAAS